MPIHSVFLKYFDEVCRCGSIRLAARRLYVASSAVNRQIIKLENELDIRLFERSASGIQLTAAGEILARHVRHTLSDAEQTLAEIALLKHNQREQIAIAGQDSVIARFLPPALLQLYSEFPAVATVFKAASGTRLQELVTSGSADIALAFDPPAHPAILQIAAIELPVGAVMTPAHPLAGCSRITLRDCGDYPIVLPDRSWPLRERLDQAIRASGLALNIITSSNSVEFLKAMVDQQLGIGFQTIVGIEAQVEQGELILIPLIDTRPVQQTFALCVRATRTESPVMQCILRLLEERLKKYASAV
jgi:DNA-binding transcriptional LysR family regulator